MRVEDTSLAGVKCITPQMFGDQRGFFMETWNLQRYREHGIEADFVQSNVSRSAQGVLRGLHFQNPYPQGKLVHVLEGAVYDVAVDIRRGSPQFGQWYGVELSAGNRCQLYIPEGFAHGFCVTAGPALFAYLCTRPYHAEADHGIAWNDPAIAIDWPLAAPEVSARDSAHPGLSEIEASLPRYVDC